MHGLLNETSRNLEGMLEVSVSASGFVRLEFDTTKTDEAKIMKSLRKEGLKIPDRRVSAERFLREKEKAKKARAATEQKRTRTREKKKDHDHAHGGIFGKNTELIFSIISGALLGIGFGLSFVNIVPSEVSLALYIGAYFFGGYFTAKEAIQTVAKGGFEIDFLMLVAAIGAAILGEWAEGALLLFPL